LTFDPVSDEVGYPLLSESELAEVAQFGEKRTFAENQPLFSAGNCPFNSYTILTGVVRIIDTSQGTPRVFVRYGPGHFTGDIDLLTQRPSLVTCEAETPVVAVQLNLNQLLSSVVSASLEEETTRPQGRLSNSCFETVCLMNGWTSVSTKTGSNWNTFALMCGLIQWLRTE
jgi:CRP-like cAMP-binding protein